MKLSRILLIAAAAALIVGVFVMPGAEEVLAAAASVTNPGRDGATCNLTGQYSGSGKAIIVETSKGTTFRCNGMIDQVPPDKVLVTSAEVNGFGACPLRITPGGHFSVSCR